MNHIAPEKSNLLCYTEPWYLSIISTNERFVKSLIVLEEGMEESLELFMIIEK